MYDIPGPLQQINFDLYEAKKHLNVIIKFANSLIILKTDFHQMILHTDSLKINSKGISSPIC